MLRFTACRFGCDLGNFAAKILPPFRRRTLSRRSFHFSCRLIALAAVVAPFLSLGGCAMFHQGFWSMDRYRDERAVDIDSRLNKNETIVKNPF
jgi:hypothetical protein